MGTAQNATMEDLKATHKRRSCQASDWRLEHHFNHRKRARTGRVGQTIFLGCCWHLFD